MGALRSSRRGCRVRAVALGETSSEGGAGWGEGGDDLEALSIIPEGDRAASSTGTGGQRGPVGKKGRRWVKKRGKK